LTSPGAQKLLTSFADFSRVGHLVTHFAGVFAGLLVSHEDDLVHHGLHLIPNRLSIAEPRDFFHAIVIVADAS
jgi:hypothetical protein